MRPSATAFSDTTLSCLSNSTWSRVKANSAGIRPSSSLFAVSVTLPSKLAIPNGKGASARLAVGGRQDEFHDFAHGFDGGPAKLVGRARNARAAQKTRGGLGDIADIDGLQPGLAAADQRQDRHDPRHRGEAVEELVFRAEHHRGAQDLGRGDRGETAASPAALLRA